jgi:hypothetical protein
MPSFIGKDADSDWLSENVVLANRVNGAHRTRKAFFLDCFTGSDRLFRNVGNYQYTLRNIPEERGYHLHLNSF